MPVIPLPTQQQPGDGQYYFPESVVISHTEDVHASSAQLLAQHLKERLHVDSSVVLATEVPEAGAAVSLVCESQGVESLSALPNSQESYDLRINDDGIRIRSQAAHGVFHGVQSLLQLLPPTPVDGGVCLDHQQASASGYSVKLYCSRALPPAQMEVQAITADLVPDRLVLVYALEQPDTD